MIALQTSSFVIPDHPRYPALDVRDVSVHYPGHHAPAMEHISFTMYVGERIGLLGPNGAGKSTLFKTIMGLLKPAQGELMVEGMPPGTSTAVAYVPQFEEIDWKFPVTVWDVVMMGRTRHIGWFRHPRRGSVHEQVVAESLARVGLSALANRQIGALSGGQKRRAFIARALAQDARTLLLDEPFAGVDAKAQESLFGVLDDLRATGVSVLLATHDLGIAATHFDKLLLVNKQQIAFGDVYDVFQPEKLARAFGGQLAIWNAEAGTMMVTDQHCC